MITFSLDALHTQKTLDAACSASCDIIFQVKANQIALKNDCLEYERLFEPVSTYQEEDTKAHGRIENRVVKLYIFKASDREKWGSKLSYMAVVTRNRQKFCTKKKAYQSYTEKAYFATTAKLPA